MTHIFSLNSLFGNPHRSADTRLRASPHYGTGTRSSSQVRRCPGQRLLYVGRSRMSRPREGYHQIPRCIYSRAAKAVCSETKTKGHYSSHRAICKPVWPRTLDTYRPPAAAERSRRSSVNYGMTGRTHGPNEEDVLDTTNIEDQEPSRQSQDNLFTRPELTPHLGT